MTKIPKLIRGAEPQFYHGGSVGCLISHGFMASPAEVGWLGQYLAERGHTVYVPRLTGHGIDPLHMRRMRWQDWYGQVLDVYHILRQQCEQVILMGHSMGALLSIILAANEPVDGLVVTAAPISLREKSLSLRLARYLKVFLPYTMHPSEKELNAEIEAEQVKRGEAVLSRVHYAKWSTRAVHEFGLAEKIAREHLPKISTPLLLLYAEGDETGTVSDMELIASTVRSKVLEKHVLKDGAHIIFQDAGREEAFRVVSDFVSRIRA
jgi:carboxylesterase